METKMQLVTNRVAILFVKKIPMESLTVLKRQKMHKTKKLHYINT